MDQQARNKILERDKFCCQKCGFAEESELETHHITPQVLGGEEKEENLITLCSICHHYAPDSAKEFKIYLSEKLDWKILETFRRSNRSISKKTRQGMERNISEGKVISRAPLGYKIINKELVIDPEKSEQLKSIFKEFSETQISLTQLGKKHGFTTSGIKKLLMNTSYLGKVKFADHENDGTHPAIIDQELFDKAQNRFLNI
ncbi:HNH endonuclease [uncultured archaeon]|nr:HNH endonuclease [uncultured archaeon]